MTNLLLKENIFLPSNPEPNKSYPQIPKQNQRFLELKPELTEERTIELSVSSDSPYYRWFGYEELDHSPDAVNLERFNDGAQALFNHNRNDYIGIIQKAWLDGGKLYNQILFDTHDLAEKIYQSIKSGIVRNVSIGYEINELKLVGQKDNIDLYRATRWTPFETSIVTVPADPTVGINRSYFVIAQGENSVKEKDKSEADIMPEAVIDEKDVRKLEQERVQGIYALVKKYGHAELAQKAIEEDLSIESARSLYLDKVNESSKQEPVAVGVAPVGMSRKQRQIVQRN